MALSTAFAGFSPLLPDPLCALKQGDMKRTFLSPMLCVLFLSGCSTPEGAFPSLAKRPFETEVPVAAPAPPPVMTAETLPDDIADKVQSLLKRHEKAQAAFDKDLPSIRGIASKAAGSEIGGENWVSAQTQLSRLDKVRADSVTVQGEMDILVTTITNGETNENTSGIINVLTEYQMQLGKAVDKQTDEIDRLSKLIGE
jgi:hypothetical protein